MFRGVFTAMVTPFNGDESIDEAALRELVDVQIRAGVHGLVPMGTTGESPTVTHEENIRVIEVVVEQTAGRVPVIAGTGSNSTAEAVRMTKLAASLGADATLQVAPYYNKPSAEGYYRHFTTVADEARLPVLVYNIPGRTGKNIDNETMLRLAAHQLIVGVKEASGSMPQVMDLIRRKPAGFDLLSGDDNLALPIVALGGAGVVSVASNLVPEQIVGMVGAALDGNHDHARAEHYRLLPLFQGLFLDTNPIPIKYAMAQVHGMVEQFRLPLCPMSEALKAQMDAVLNETGIR